MAQRKTPRTSSTKRTKAAKAPSRSAKTTARTAAAKKNGKKSPASRAPHDVAPGDRELTIDRRRSDAKQTASASSKPAAPVTAPVLERRKKVNRRRQIDPTTCERDYTDQEVEFMNAIDDYKRTSGRMFPTCSEVLEVLRGLGYAKLAAPVAKLHESPAAATPILSGTDTFEFEAEAALQMQETR